MQKTNLHLMWQSTITISLFCFFSLSTVWAGQLHLYPDADFTHANTSSISSEQGILTALSEVDNFVADQEIVLIRKNHRGNNRRSNDALQDFLADAKGLVVFCGLHSTVVLANLQFIHDNNTLLLRPRGISVDEYTNEITPKGLQQVDLNFLQTKFSFLFPQQAELGNSIFYRATKLFPDTTRRLEDIKAPDGFIHGYDLTKILIAAIEQAGLTGEIETDRENLKTPAASIIINYQQPFRRYSPDDPDAPEALGREELKMGQYASNGEIVLLGAYSE